MWGGVGAWGSRPASCLSPLMGSQGRRRGGGCLVEGMEPPNHLASERWDWRSNLSLEKSQESNPGPSILVQTLNDV